MRSSPVRSARAPRKIQEHDITRKHIREAAVAVRLLEPYEIQELISRRQERDIDQYDEMWEGVYVVPPLATNPHQKIVGFLVNILFDVVALEGKGDVFPGANISDRKQKWEKNYRCADVVVVLKEGQAIDCGTHWLGGPDFLVEIQSPRDDTEEKVPFYSGLGVRELLIIHRDTRAQRLYRHDGQQLALVSPTPREDGEWLESAVVPLAFRRTGTKKQPKTAIRRTDGQPGNWTV
jgi:Uma2 family endonuclease